MVIVTAYKSVGRVIDLVAVDYRAVMRRYNTPRWRDYNIMWGKQTNRMRI